jgi:tRNA threonylcarbamoyladenosine biosynthesis protein TsaB
LRILSIDTATRKAAVALVDERKTRYEVMIDSDFKHSRTLLEMVDSALGKTGTGWEQVAAIAVTSGPGSFTGLRIGMATAKGLALAVGKPIIGVPTLDALAYNVGWAAPLICPALNARKGEVYSAFYRGGGEVPQRLTPDLACSPGELAEKARGLLQEMQIGEIMFLGDGIQEYGELWKSCLGADYVTPPEPLCWTRAPAVGRLAFQRWQSGAIDDVFTLVPGYIRLSEAEIKLGEK